jgi:hypothetical protein
MKQRRRLCDRFARKKFTYGRNFLLNRSNRFNGTTCILYTGYKLHVVVVVPQYVGMGIMEMVGRRQRAAVETAATGVHADGFPSRRCESDQL